MKNLMKSILFLTLTLILMSASCDRKEVKSTADQQLQSQTEQSMIEANRQVGMPAITNFQEKKLMKDILELRDRENLICHAYLTSLDGSIGQYLGKCIGYGLPYSTQFSNPMKYGEVDGGEYGARNPYTMPQPETNEPRPVYIEPAIIVSPFKLHK